MFTENEITKLQEALRRGQGTQAVDEADMEQVIVWARETMWQYALLQMVYKGEVALAFRDGELKFIAQGRLDAQQMIEGETWPE